jgi:hypothetical protein
MASSMALVATSAFEMTNAHFCGSSLPSIFGAIFPPSNVDAETRKFRKFLNVR